MAPTRCAPRVSPGRWATNPVERATRSLILVSTLAALLAYGWLVSWLPGVRVAAAAAFVLGFALTRVSLPLGLAIPLVLAYVSPALLMVAFGTADYHVTLVWLASLAGPIFARSNWGRWHLPSGWTLPFAGSGLVVACTWPIIAGREIDFSLVAARTFDTATGLLGGPPPPSAAWIINVALGQMLGLLWFDLLWARFGASRVERAARVVLVPLLVSALLGALAGIYQGYVDLEWVNPGIWPNLRRAGGLMLDANSFGMICAIWAALAVGLAWQADRAGMGARPGRAWIGWAAFGVLVTAMWASGSRTALLTLCVGLVGIGVGALQRRGSWQPRLVPLGLMIGGAIAVLVLTLAPRGGNSPSPLQRVFDRLPGFGGPSPTAFADEMWSRFGYGDAAARAIREHPASGVGVGAFHTLSTDYYYLDSGILNLPDNAQNWWRHQFAELGLVGAVPVVWASLLIFGLVWRGGARAGHREPASVVRGVVAGLGLASLVGMPTQHPAMWLTFMTLVFWLAALAAHDESPASHPVPRESPPTAGWVVIALIVIATMIGQTLSATGDLRLPARAQRAGFPFTYGLSASEPSADYGELRWTTGHAVAVAPAEHQWLELTLWALHPDIDSAPVTARVWRDGELVIEIELTDSSPVTRVIHASDSARFAWLEIGASRTFGDGRGLRIATRWHRQVPEGTAADKVVP